MIQIERFNLGRVDAGDVGKEIYRLGMQALRGLMYVGSGTRKPRVLDLHCSQSFVREFVGDNVDYAGLDPRPSFERDGKKVVPEIRADVNNMPLENDSVDFMFAVGQNVGYGPNHKSVFEIERVIRPNGRLIVAQTRYWFMKGYNQLLFCHRDWYYVKAIEVNYKIGNGSNVTDTSCYFSVYQYQKSRRSS